jgi:hypothetical protein
VAPNTNTSTVNSTPRRAGFKDTTVLDSESDFGPGQQAKTNRSTQALQGKLCVLLTYELNFSLQSLLDSSETVTCAITRQLSRRHEFDTSRVKSEFHLSGSEVVAITVT